MALLASVVVGVVCGAWGCWRTGEVMEVKASRPVSFKPASALKGKL